MRARCTAYALASAIGAAIRPSFPREVAEAALAHIVGDQAEQAYRRGDAIQKRRALMTEWAAFCAGAKK